MIEQIRLQWLQVQLREPYKLALGAIEHFETLLIRVVALGLEGVGEASILTGYTSETIEGSWREAERLSPRLIGLATSAAKALVHTELLEKAPFTATAFVTAIEMAEGHSILEVSETTSVRILAGINAIEESEIEREVEAALAAGYDTLKIKVGFDVSADLRRVDFIQRCNAGRARLRLDANQGYSQIDGEKFAANVAPDCIELFEQPCAAHDWKAAEAIIKVSNVPVMLDESIYDLNDVRRAANVGAKFVKLKLMKMGSLRQLEDGLELIRELGMEPVLGNGVATDIGCWMEACVARNYVTNAGEMNGFLRLRNALACEPMEVVCGSIRLRPRWSPTLDDRRLRDVCVAALRFNKSGKHVDQ